ncbi:hypothetical protein OBBRIDRAFT_547800 [Obba rivulosa]|uniref:Uncharacterized protein n=1 Tax=Obba rivulosa TaxID=1052685 RepID=A0A8E2DDD1_9APHY|nr:hypothetical protein OBBRIDRAFT_547800 [Obba rivulosa]
MCAHANERGVQPLRTSTGLLQLSAVPPSCRSYDPGRTRRSHAASCSRRIGMAPDTRPCISYYRTWTRTRPTLHSGSRLGKESSSMYVAIFVSCTDDFDTEVSGRPPRTTSMTTMSHSSVHMRASTTAPRSQHPLVRWINTPAPTHAPRTTDVSYDRLAGAAHLACYASTVLHSSPSPAWHSRALSRRSPPPNLAMSLQTVIWQVDPCGYCARLARRRTTDVQCNRLVGTGHLACNAITALAAVCVSPRPTLCPSPRCSLHA